jgi:hypothetical protein
MERGLAIVALASVVASPFCLSSAILRGSSASLIANSNKKAQSP